MRVAQSSSQSSQWEREVEVTAGRLSVWEIVPSTLCRERVARPAKGGDVSHCARGRRAKKSRTYS